MAPKRKPSKPNPWKRFVSENDDKYTAVMNIRVVLKHGLPVDPWGDEMQPKEATLEELREEWGE